MTRILIDTKRRWTKLLAIVSMTLAMFRAAPRCRIVHLHGFSQKSILIMVLARLMSKRVIITIHTADDDDPQGVRRSGALAYWIYQEADRFIAISNLMADRFRGAGLPAAKLRIAPNGLDTDRFRPASQGEAAEIRRQIDAPVDVPLILFVGLFSRDKRPDVLYEAWLQLRAAHGIDSVLMFVGATVSAYYEVDADLHRSIMADARERGLSHLVRFAGEVPDIERYYRTADAFVMPSTREAFGMALLEGMATGLPVIATRIDRVTDDIVTDGETGILVAGGDAAAIAEGLRRVLTDRALAVRLGTAARRSVIERYGLAASRQRWAAIYQELVAR